MADRYLVECSTKPCSDYGTNDYRFKNAEVVKLRPNQNVFSTGELLAMECKAKSEGKEEGQNEAWDLAQKILKLPGLGGYTDQELCEIFNFGAVPVISDLIRRYTYQEVVAKIQNWEEKKAKEFHPGDVVTLKWGSRIHKAVVTMVMPDLLGVVLDTGNVYDVGKSRCTKTGKTIGIAAMLVELNGEEE